MGLGDAGSLVRTWGRFSFPLDELTRRADIGLAATGGFRGSSYMDTPRAGSSNPAHLPSTYTAILILAILRADLSRLNRRGLWEFVNSCQEPDGS